MSVRSLNPKLQKRLEAVRRAMDAGLPTLSEARALAEWVGSRPVLAEAQSWNEIAAAVEAFQLADIRIHTLGRHRFEGGYVVTIDAMEQLVDYLRAAQAVMELKVTGRLRLASPDLLATLRNVVGELEP